MGATARVGRWCSAGSAPATPLVPERPEGEGGGGKDWHQARLGAICWKGGARSVRMVLERSPNRQDLCSQC